ncbi:MAG TPA: glucokinase [Candidatus Angelobacter sp.]|nr:glucokinase [Candidatus Angelobacter sp.]
MILAGDIGGTHSRIALFEAVNNKLRLVVERIYPSREHSGLEEIISLFLTDQETRIEAVCFGIAGPVINGRVSTPNLPWIIDSIELAKHSGLPIVWIINDLHAHASGIDDLGAADAVALNDSPSQAGNAGLIAAGTGLGEAGLYWDGSRRYAFPCEGGHADFAPRNDLEIALLRYLLSRFGRVSYERVLSGPGLVNIYEFLRESGAETEPEWLADELKSSNDAGATISHHGMSAEAPICEHAIDLFVSIYGAEAGNLALKLLATGGIFVSGGIAKRILPKLQQAEFRRAFTVKGRLQPLLEKIPVRVIVNDAVGLLGAARYALNQTQLKMRAQTEGTEQ